MRCFLVVLALAVGAQAHFFPIWKGPFTQDISKAPLDRESNQTIAWLVGAGGFGGGSFRVDFSFHILRADRSTPRANIVQRSGYYLPDCVKSDKVQFPLPAGGAIEGQTGYSCSGGDCHLNVVDTDANYLYESYVTNVNAGAVQSQCVIVWNLTYPYPANLRGDQCTSADAAGFPIAPLLFTADEVAAGKIDHAIRFILPNNRMRSRTYVHPASHAGGPSAPAPAPIYGTRFRLKSSFQVSKLKPSAQVVARALQTYGMFLADGGNIALTAQSDRFTTRKWSALQFDARSLTDITAADFEVIDGGTRVEVTNNCKRNFPDPL